MERKTKVELFLEPYTQYFIEPVRIASGRRNLHDGAPITGTTNREGRAIIELAVSLYPYRLKTATFSENFIVVATEPGQTLDVRDMYIGHLTYEPFTETGKLLIEAKETLAKASGLNKQLNQKLKFIEDFTALVLNSQNPLRTQIAALEALVQSVTNDRLFITEQVRRTQNQWNDIQNTLAAMIQIAADYQIAKTFNAIRLGTGYLWTDANGHLRFKNGEPNDDLDGMPLN